MDWELVIILVAILAGGSVSIMIVAMVVGAVRSTRHGVDWSHSSDRDFVPWDEDEGDN
jgi:hypothetical protein